MFDKYKAIIFDWDGTLVDTCGLILDAHNHVREAMGHDKWTSEEFVGQSSKSAREYYPIMYKERSDEAMDILKKYVRDNHLKSLEPMEHAKEALNGIKHPMGIVSNKTHEFLQIEIDHLGWRGHFETAIGAGHADKDKPHTAPMLMAINGLKGDLSPQDILYIGDTETDLLTAQNMGCDVALVQSDRPRPDLVEKYNPAYVWNDLTPLIEGSR